LKEIIRFHCERFPKFSDLILYETENFFAQFLGINPNTVDLSFIPQLQTMFPDVYSTPDLPQFEHSVSIPDTIPETFFPNVSHFETPKQSIFLTLICSFKSAFESDPSMLKEIIQSHCEKFPKLAYYLLFHLRTFLSRIFGINPNTLDLSFIPELQTMFPDVKPPLDSSELEDPFDFLSRFFDEPDSSVSDLESPEQHPLFVLVFSLKAAFEFDPSKLKEIIQTHCEMFPEFSANLLFDTRTFFSEILGINPNTLDLSFIPGLRARFPDVKPLLDSSEFEERPNSLNPVQRYLRQFSQHEVQILQTLFQEFPHIEQLDIIQFFEACDKNEQLTRNILTQ
jgi:hypothetical protein